MKIELHREEVEILRAMDNKRVSIWNTKKSKDAPDRLIDVRDGAGIASFFRSVRVDK